MPADDTAKMNRSSPINRHEIWRLSYLYCATNINRTWKACLHNMCKLSSSKRKLDLLPFHQHNIEKYPRWKYPRQVLWWTSEMQWLQSRWRSKLWLKIGGSTVIWYPRNLLMYKAPVRLAAQNRISLAQTHIPVDHKNWNKATQIGWQCQEI